MADSLEDIRNQQLDGDSVRKLHVVTGIGLQRAEQGDHHFTQDLPAIPEKVHVVGMLGFDAEILSWHQPVPDLDFLGAVEPDDTDGTHTVTYSKRNVCFIPIKFLLPST